jgi:predicted O-linked N-acetylglucosamine transferase (SPINDLY family)
VRRFLERLLSGRGRARGDPPSDAGSGPSRDADSAVGAALEAHQAGDLAAAEAAYRRALTIDPDHGDALKLLGSVLGQTGRPEEASRMLERARDVDPDAPDTRALLGNVYALLGRTTEAMDAYGEAIARRPDDWAARNNLGLLCYREGRLAEAAETLAAVVEAIPGFAKAHNNLGLVLQAQARHVEAEAAFRRALEADPDYGEAGSNLLLGLNYRGDLHPEVVFAAHRAWADRHARPAAGPATPGPEPGDAERRLRLGYLSPDFRAHPVALFFEPLLAAHDRSAFEVVCYSAAARPDPVTERLRRSADGWRDVLGLGDSALAERIRADRVDILVDLAGHTADNRLSALARRPAPVQVTYLGYPNTTGLECVDYRVTDVWADPPGPADRLHTETLLRLPSGFLAYAPPPGAPAAAPPPSAAGAPLTFGSFNNAAKLGPEVIATWSRVLRRVPGARLLLKSRQFEDDATRERFRGAFVEAGVPVESVELVGWIPAIESHLEHYARVDVGLDPFPYNGTTTTCEALWMGVPVVALAGDRHAARVGVSVLERAGLADLVVADETAYVERAADLAQDAAGLVRLRETLRGRLAGSPAADVPGLTLELETAFREIWRRRCAGVGGNGR